MHSKDNETLRQRRRSVFLVFRDVVVPGSSSIVLAVADHVPRLSKGVCQNICSLKSRAMYTVTCATDSFHCTVYSRTAPCIPCFPITRHIFETMPVCAVHLVHVRGDLSQFLTKLIEAPEQPLVVSRVIRWIIKPTSLTVDPLLTQQPPWDLLLVYPSNSGLPLTLRSQAAAIFTIEAGVPSSITSKFVKTNERLLHPQASDVPQLTGALDKPRLADSAQNLELTDELRSWIDTYDVDGKKGAVSMLNLLAFKHGMHAEYLKYGKAFSESIGARRGGNAKIVGKVIGGDKGTTPADGGWDEVALAHYPSIWHFADMAGSEDYQEVNHKHRIPALRDTCILMTSELALPQGSGRVAKL